MHKPETWADLDTCHEPREHADHMCEHDQRGCPWTQEDTDVSPRTCVCYVKCFPYQVRPFFGYLRKILRQKGAHKPTGNSVPIHAGEPVGGSGAEPTQPGSRGAGEPESRREAPAGFSAQEARRARRMPCRQDRPAPSPCVQIPQGTGQHMTGHPKQPSGAPRLRTPRRGHVRDNRHRASASRPPSAWVTGSRTQRAPEKLPVPPLSNTSTGVTQKSQIS